MDSLVDIIPALKRVLDNLEKIQEEKGVPKNKEIIDKNITNSSLNENKSTDLSSGEVKKLRAVFTIFSEVFFDYQKKFTVDTKPKTLISTVAKPIEKQKETTEDYSFFGTGKKCTCNIKKEHIHCTVCGGIRQIG